MSPTRQTWVSLTLAALIAATFVALHIYAVFMHDLSTKGWLAAPFLIAVLCWLNVGLFIVAHDCMHGSLTPGRPSFNRWIGRIALALYAGFSFDRLLPKHFRHHKHPGTPQDPDFSTSHSRHFWPWFFRFLRQYFGLREFVVLTVLVWIYVMLLGAPYGNLLIFWALPAILSSLQLFLFGTFLPHRVAEAEFADSHRARSNNYGNFASLLTCFHFGYHHEHHLAPQVPWWQLPQERRAASMRSAARPTPPADAI